LNAPDASAGKRVKCPKCGETIPVPEAESDFEVVDHEPAPPRPAKPVVARKLEDDEDDRPRKKSRRRDEEDEDDDRPRKKKGGDKKKGGPPIVLLAAIGGGVALLAIVGTILFFVFGGKPTGPGGLLGPSTPPGYTAVNDSEGGFQVFLPGTVVKSTVDVGDQNRKLGVESSAYAGQDGQTSVRAVSVKPPTGTVPGDSPEQLFSSVPGVNAKWYTIVSKESITLDGKPALLVKVKDNKNWMDDGRKDPADMPPPPGLQGEQLKDWLEMQAEMKRTRDEIKKDIDRDRSAQPVVHYVYLITTDRKRVITITIQKPNEFPGEDVLKTVRDSFRFR
jgi:hypothetical protein